jgi:Ca2+/H+ antiporter, TMEM165/GDT1 family
LTISIESPPLIALPHLLSVAIAAFLAALVEAVEALTVVLAIGAVRGWRWPLFGVLAALTVLLLLCALFGPALAHVPLHLVQTVVGALLLLFGLRWLRKAILRSARIIPFHDEVAAYASAREALTGGARTRFDGVAFGSAFQIVMLEGIEVVFIVLAVGAGGPGTIAPAAIGALAAIAVIVLLGLIVHRPLARVPENVLKFIVGVMLCAFGTFWVGEGIGIVWRYGDAALIGLMTGYGALALGAVGAKRAILEDPQ